MEKSNIKSIDTNYLNSIGFKGNQINQIYDLINRSIKEQLYTKIHFPYHNLEHIERVLCYCILLYIMIVVEISLLLIKCMGLLEQNLLKKS